MRSLPKVVSNIPNDLRAFVDRVREYIANAGDESFVTKGELLRGGIIKTTPGGTIIPPDQVVVGNPTKPTGLTASGALANIILSWDAPNYAGHLETRVFAAATDDFSAKILVGSSPGTTFAHNLGSGATRYYWIQHVNINLVEGPFNDIAGTLGMTGTDPAYVLDVLAGAITETELYSGLNERIDLIDGSPTTPGTIPYQLSVLQGQIDELSTTPAYDNATTYNTGDLVQYSGGLYQAIATTTGNLPTDTTYWLKIGDYTSLGDAVATHTTQITTLTTDLGAETTARQALAAQMRGSYTGTDLSLVTSGLIFSERTARASAVAAETSSREALAAQVRGGYTGTDLSLVTSGLIFSERTARASADSAMASDISTLSTTVGNQTTAVQTLSQSVDGIKGLYTVKIDNNGNVSGFGLESVLDNVAIPLWTASTAFSIGAVRRIAAVSTKVMRCTVAGTSGTSTPTMAGAVGTTFTDGSVTWEIASSTATSTFIANVDQFAVAVPTSAITAWVTGTAYTVGAFVGVASSTTKMLVCRVAGTSGGSTPAIGTTAIGALVTDGTVVWQVASRVPLSVLTTTQTINGVTVPPGVYIDGASIVNATINNAQIANLAIDNAKIANMAVDKLTAGALQVGSYIQSTSYSAGSTGWRINADGTAEFANAIVRGSIFGGAASAYSTGIGLFAGLDAGTYKFRVGNPSGNRLDWNGSTLAITGTLSSSTINGGSITGTTINGGTITSGSATGPLTGTGFYVSGGVFRVGNPSGNYIYWNGSTLTIVGQVVTTSNIAIGGVSALDSVSNLSSIDMPTAGTTYTVAVGSATVPENASGVVITYSIYISNDLSNSKDLTFTIQRGASLTVDSVTVRVKPGADQVITRFAVDKPPAGVYTYPVTITPIQASSPGNLVIPAGGGKVMNTVYKR